MVVAAIGHAVMNMTATQRAAFHSAKRVTGSIAETRRMSVAAVRYAVMNVTACLPAALHRAKRAAASSADRTRMIGAGMAVRA